MFGLCFAATNNLRRSAPTQLPLCGRRAKFVGATMPEEESAARKRIKAKVAAKAAAWTAAERAAEAAAEAERASRRTAVTGLPDEDDGMPALQINDDSDDGLMMMLEDNESDDDEPSLEDNEEDITEGPLLEGNSDESGHTCGEELTLEANEETSSSMCARRASRETLPSKSPKRQSWCDCSDDDESVSSCLSTKVAEADSAQATDSAMCPSSASGLSCGLMSGPMTFGLPVSPFVCLDTITLANQASASAPPHQNPKLAAQTASPHGGKGRKGGAAGAQWGGVARNKGSKELEPQQRHPTQRGSLRAPQHEHAGANHYKHQRRRQAAVQPAHSS